MFMIHGDNIQNKRNDFGGRLIGNYVCSEVVVVIAGQSEILGNK